MATSGELKWVERPFDPAKALEFAFELDLHRSIVRILLSRGIDTIEKAKRFLNPSLHDLRDPSGFAGVDAAVARLCVCIGRGEVIGIFGDYDVDGVTSTALLSEFIELIGGKSVATLPDRIKEGYGLSKVGVDRLKEQGVSVVVTVDCGITNHAEIDYAVEQGLDVIVVDHHQVPVELPKAVAVMNPHRSDCFHNAEHLCAVGVVFNLCVAWRKALREQGYFAKRPEPKMAQLLDLVALGTVADVVPLIDENRVFVRHGIDMMARGIRPGIVAMLDVAGIERRKVTGSTLGFQLGPRINAAGRLGDAMKAVRLLREREYFAALAMAKELDAQNQSRRDIEFRVVEEARAMIDASEELQAAPILVVGSERWHPGVVGIVASRLVERYGRPALVIGEGGKGSGRSMPQLHLHEALLAVSHTLKGFGGHAHAVGLHIDMDSLADFRAAIVAHVEEKMAGKPFERHNYYDGELGLDDIHADFVTQLAQLAPYGRSNPEPVFCLRGVRFDELKDLKGGHIRGIVRSRVPLDFVAFGVEEKRGLFLGRADILVTPEFNVWRDTKKLQLRIKDIRVG